MAFRSDVEETLNISSDELVTINRRGYCQR